MISMQDGSTSCRRARRSVTAALRDCVVAVSALLGLSGCIQLGLKTPIGDPEHSRLDQRISGVWLNSQGGDCDFLVFEPFGARTWLVLGANVQKRVAGAAPGKPQTEIGTHGSSPPQGVAHGKSSALQPVAQTSLAKCTAEGQYTVASINLSKGWLTSIGDRRYLVLEPKANLSSARGFRPEEWLVFHVRLRGDQLLLWLIDNNVEHLRDVTSRSKAERIIAAHGRELDAAITPLSLMRVPLNYYDGFQRILSTGNLR